MIIKSSRVASGGVSRFLINHLLHGDENDAVEIMSGGADHMTRCVEDADGKNCRYAIRHIIIATDQPLANDEVLWIVAELAREFGFRPDNITLVRHWKERHGLFEDVPHFHVAVPEYDPENSAKVLSSRWSYPRQEKIARAAELRFGHRPTPGPWQKSVVKTLEEEGRHEEANAIRHLEPSRDPGQPSTTIDAGVVVRLKREGVAFDDVRMAFEMSANASEFIGRLAAMGLSVAPGLRRATTPCLFKNDEHLGALHRILGMSVVDLRAFLDTRQEPVASPPANAFLSHEQVSEALQSLRSGILPRPIDRSGIEKAEAQHRRLINEEKASLAKLRDAEGRLRSLENEYATEAALFGWLDRHLLRRGAYRSLVFGYEARRSQLQDAADTCGRSAKQCAADRIEHRPDLLRARQVLESRTAFFADKADGLRKASDQVAQVALSGRFRFRDHDELRHWIENRGPGTDIVDRTDMWGIGQPAPQARKRH